MSSLQSIMNLDDDQHDTSNPMDKKVMDPATPVPGFRSQDPLTSTLPSHVIRTGQQHSSSSSPLNTYTTSTASSSTTTTTTASTSKSTTYTSRPGQLQSASDLASDSAAQQGNRPAETSSATPTLSTATLGPGDSRRQSSTSVDSMDQHGYGSAAASSSLGGGAGSGAYSSNMPIRPMGTSPGPEVPIRLTPITGRVSRAKKGVPVHVCDTCNPPKTFTRAEHLRRHHLSHQKPQFPCNYPDCNRAFHRQDLLNRHKLRHQEGDKPSGRRDSRDSETLDDQIHRPGFGPLQPQPGFPSSSIGSTAGSDIAPNTPPPAITPGSAPMSPPPGGNGNPYEPSAGNQEQTAYDRYGFSDIGQSGEDRMEHSPEPALFTTSTYIPPRSVQMPLFVTTQSLSPSVTLQTTVPELEYTWTSTSDNSNSNYSTPSDMSRPRQHPPLSSLDWQTTPNMLAPNYSAGVRREISTGGGLATMSTSFYVPPPFPVSPHLPPVPHHPYGTLLSEPLMPSFGEEQTHLLDPSISGHHAIHHQSPSVRSPSPQTSVSVSGQAADTLVTPAPLHRVDPMAQVIRQKEIVVNEGNADVSMVILGAGWARNNPGGAGIPTAPGLATFNGCGIGGVSTVTPLPRVVRNSIPSYIDAYWEHVHHCFPFVHRRSVEEAGEEVLRCAMAAMATQYLNSKEDRIRGSQLHEYAWQEAKRYPQWNLQVMQAILLCELFARFRARKAVVRPSKLFESLYSRVTGHSPNMFDATSSSGTTGLGHTQQDAGLNMTKEERWHRWLDAEARRRLLAMCFNVDNQAANYHQQSRARDDINPSIIPLTGYSDALWEANSADEWFAILEVNPTNTTPQFLPSLDTLGPEDISQYTVFDQATILHAAAASLPRRQHNRSTADKGDGNQDSNSVDDLRTPTTASYAAQSLKATKSEEQLAYLFSHCISTPVAYVYLALHHTPLHDLLAVSGDSWVFSQKVLGAPTFLEHQKRLKAWVEGRSSSMSPTTGASQPSSPTTAGLEGMSSTKATIYAARALVGLLDSLSGHGPTPYLGSVSTYWAIYVCALIIWAFGHRAGKSSSSSSSGGSSASPKKGGPMTDDDALNWLRMVADIGQSEHLSRVRGRREASASVVGMTKRILEADCVGGRSRLYVDAVGVLKKLEEGINWRWF